MNSPRICLAAALALLAIDALNPANADVRQRLKIRMQSDTVQPATTGKTYSGVLELIAPKDGVIGAVEIGGDAWRPLTIGLAAATRIAQGEHLLVPFEASVLDAARMLEVWATLDGVTTHKRFDLSPERFARRGTDRPIVRVESIDHVFAYDEEGGGDIYWHRNYGSGYVAAENIAHSVYTAGQTLHLRIEARGNTFTCWANDSPTPTTTFTTPDFPTGRIGLLDGVAAGTASDNVFIQTLASCDPNSGLEPVRIIQRPQLQTVRSGRW